ncbi:MAG: class II aldolase/adducin family protein [Deltaproteobacteria bacterium]|nr:class II aldolase/adducin family protein [Deltaproteobacteria bacterium]
MHVHDQKKELVDICHRASERWLTAGSGGNISVRIPNTDRYLCTATGVTFRDTAVENIVEMDLAGTQRGGDAKPSKEYRWHAGILALCPDVHGVVHTHSTATMALGIVGVTPPHMTGQARAHLGAIQIVPYADAGSERLRDLIVDVYRAHPATRIVLLANHGLAATGPTLLEAYNRAEIVEDSAQAYLHCRLLGREPNLEF